MGHAANIPNDFHSKFIKTDVTAIKINFNFILAGQQTLTMKYSSFQKLKFHYFSGIGNVLHVFNITNKQCQFCTALQEQRIHGIRFNAKSDLVAIYGNREIAIASFHFTNIEATLTILNRWIVGDWICDVKWSEDSDQLLILTANNIISAWDWRNRTSSQSVKCHNKCLL